MKTYIQFRTLAVSVLVMSTMIYSCVEPIEFDAETFEKVLVVEGRITNEFKYHEFKLSNSGRIDAQAYELEQNAEVEIVDGSQNVIVFNEIYAGTYRSNQEFKAIPSTTYQLRIATDDGRSYKTAPISLTNESQIDKLYAAKEVDLLGNTNLTIFIDSHSVGGDSNYYRYEYEETYKIIPDFWSPKEFVILNGNISTRDKLNYDDRVCYNTTYSSEIILTETSGLTDDVVFKFPVAILSTDNPKIAHRYSMLVRQFVQSIDANNYFKLLGGLEGNDNIFSENQLGYVPSNIISESDANEKVIGFFEVNSVVEERLFFNYVDFFPDEERPPYLVDCAPFGIPRPGSLDVIARGEVLYYANFSPDPELNEIPYLLVTPDCGDCRTQGTNIKPDFWVD